MTGRREAEREVAAAGNDADGAVRPGGQGLPVDETPPPVRIHPPVLFPAIMGAGLLLDRVVPLAQEAWPGAIRYGVGGALVLLAALLAGWAAWVFSRAGTAIPTLRPARRFVASGPYAFTRNPMYLGLVLLFAGLGLMLTSAWMLLLTPLFALLLDRLVIAREEPYLAARFGAPYRDYLRRVRRWI